MQTQVRLRQQQRQRHATGQVRVRRVRVKLVRKPRHYTQTRIEHTLLTLHQQPLAIRQTLTVAPLQIRNAM